MSGLRLGKAQEAGLRAWPRDRIRPKSVALGVISLLAEVDALRSERAAETERADRLQEAGQALHDELLEAAFGWDLGLPERVQAEARKALDRWEALCPMRRERGE